MMTMSDLEVEVARLTEVRLWKGYHKIEKDRVEKVETANHYLLQQVARAEEELDRRSEKIGELREKRDQLLRDSIDLDKTKKENRDLRTRLTTTLGAWDADKKTLTEKLGVFSHEVLDPNCAETGCQSAKLKQVEWELNRAQGVLEKVRAEELRLTEQNNRLQETLASTQTLLKRLYEAQGALWDGAAELLPKGGK